ncbi:MAG: flagellar filament capping protein FliD [Oscillospiraceae bacterium]|jgi:flagellar capping protein FliD|nr:flagellar filament capping protein FliD [Oscillospiraceae bacterium]
MAINTNYGAYSNNNIYSMFTNTAQKVNSFYKSNYTKSSYGLFNNNSSALHFLKYNKNEIDYPAMARLSEIKTGSQKLKSAIDSLSRGLTYTQKAPVSSDSEIMEVKATGTVSVNRIPETSVQIDRIAMGQENTGNSLKSSVKFGDVKDYRFEIKTEKGTKAFSVSVTASDTNESVQQKAAAAINSADIGVTASYTKNEGQGTGFLTVKSNSVGDQDSAKFMIKDITPGGIVSKTGLDAVSREAQDAAYRVNGGKLQQSSTNNVNLGNGLSAILKGASEDEIKVTVGQDSSYAVGKVNELVKEYNSLVGGAFDNLGSKGANKLFNSLVGVAKTYMPSLSRIGINLSDDGSLKIDSKKLEQSAADGSLEKFLTGGGANYGFSARLSSVTGDISRNPMAYGGKDAAFNMINSDSGNFYNSLQQTRYNQFSNIGLFLDLFL